MRRPPTERQAAMAARQLHYHRERVRWIEQKMRDNEASLLLYLSSLDANTAVLPGGYRGRDRASPDHDIAVEKLVPKNTYE